MIRRLVAPTVSAAIATTTFALADRAPEPAAGSAAIPATQVAPHVVPPSAEPVATPPSQGARQMPSASSPPPRPRLPTPTPPPPPAPEVAKLGKDVAGAYTCKGNAHNRDGSSTPLVAKLTIKLELDNAWIATSLVEKAGTGGKFFDYRTYDGVGKQWTRIQLTNASTHVMSTSLGEKDGKWMWEGAATSPRGTLQVRDYEQWSGKQVKVWGEGLMGGSWQKLYEATCKP
jgi:hypothetical protein